MRGPAVALIVLIITWFTAHPSFAEQEPYWDMGLSERDGTIDLRGHLSIPGESSTQNQFPQQTESSVASSSGSSAGGGSSSGPSSNSGGSSAHSSEYALRLICFTHKRLEIRIPEFTTPKWCDSLLNPSTPVSQPAPVGGAGGNQQVVVPDVTMSEVATMEVEPGQISTDRGGFGLIRAHTNFFVDSTETQVFEEQMFGRSVRVEMEPFRYEWDYGDGTSRTTSVGGYATEVFNDETPTSHVYDDTGQFQVNLTTHYRGTYQVEGMASRPIPGTLALDADPVTADIWRAETRNVSGPCDEAQTNWGC